MLAIDVGIVHGKVGDEVDRAGGVVRDWRSSGWTGGGCPQRRSRCGGAPPETRTRLEVMTVAALSKQYKTVEGKEMAYHEAGNGDPVVFLHGNPTSSYLWRDIVPHVSGQARCIVPDLIGQGDSDKLDDPGPGSYRFVEHRVYLDSLLDQLDLGDRVTLVVHDWGSALGFEWANRHRDRVAGIAYMEAFVRPVTWAEWPESARQIFQGFRSEAGEAMALQKNLFVEAVLPSSITRTLERGGDGGVPAPIHRAGRGPPPHADLAAPDPDRGRASRRARGRAVLRRLIVDLPGAEALHQRGSRRDPDREPARVRAHLAEPDRGDRGRDALPPGGQPARDRRDNLRLAAAARCLSSRRGRSRRPGSRSPYFGASAGVPPAATAPR